MDVRTGLTPTLLRVRLGLRVDLDAGNRGAHLCFPLSVLGLWNRKNGERPTVRRSGLSASVGLEPTFPAQLVDP